MKMKMKMKLGGDAVSGIPTPLEHLLYVLILVACSASEGEVQRCAQCGMRVDVAPRWVSGYDERQFDTPKCLFRWAQAQGADLGEAWVLDYYEGERLEVDRAHFVVGSDVLGPMGDDLVPVPDAIKAELFVRDHGGRIVRVRQIDAALLGSLDQE